MMQNLRLFVFLALLTGLSCCLFGAIFMTDLQASYDDLLGQRIGVVASDVAATVENRVNLGLPLNYLSDMQPTLERARQESSGIDSISVADEQGNVLFSTDRISIGTVSVDNHAEDLADDPDHLHFRVELRNAFDTRIGTVIVTGARTHLDPTHLAQLGLPFLAAAGFVVLGLVLTYLLTRLFLQDVEQRSRAITADAEAALRHALDLQLPATPPPGGQGWVLTPRVDTMMRTLQAATAGVQSVDETV